MPRTSILSYLTFDMEVLNILETKAYKLAGEEKVQVIKNWLGRKGLQFIKTFTDEGNENARLQKGVFSVLSHEFRLHHNWIVFSLQYLKLKRKANKLAQEWMGRMQTKGAEYDNKEYYRKGTKQFIYGLGDEGVISEILRVVSALEDINDATSEWVLLWPQREAQGVQ